MGEGGVTGVRDSGQVEGGAQGGKALYSTLSSLLRLAAASDLVQSSSESHMRSRGLGTRVTTIPPALHLPTHLSYPINLL